MGRLEISLTPSAARSVYRSNDAAIEYLKSIGGQGTAKEIAQMRDLIEIRSARLFLKRGYSRLGLLTDAANLGMGDWCGPLGNPRDTDTDS